MLPSSLLQLLLATSLLALGTRSALIKPKPLSITAHPQKPSAAQPCTNGKGLLGSSCGISSTADHNSECSPYLSMNGNCGDPSATPCRQYGPKGPPAPTSGRGHRRQYDADHHLAIRADDTGNATADNLDVDTSDSVWYAIEITVGGQNFTVQLDTGSSDLWLRTANHTVQFTNTTDLETSETYGENYVEGKIKFADVQIGDLTIESQALLHVVNSGVHGFDLGKYDGILGMAFDMGPIHAKVQEAWGAEAANNLALSPMTALFAQEPTLPNNFDIQLFRPAAELDDTAEGLLSISSHVPGFEGVVDMPVLPRVAPQHWSVAMDAMLIDGQSFTFNQSSIAGAPAGKIVAALDTGSSFPALPRAAIDAIYGSIPGALYDRFSELWVLPCDGSPNITFVFGGQQFPVHPLDLTFPVTAVLSINEHWSHEITACINTWQPLDKVPTNSDGFDIILADAFLHNVYISFNYGDWNPANNTNGSPFVQMISTTDSATMWGEFYSNRTATLARLPLPLDPAAIVYYDGQPASNGSDPTSSMTTTSSTAATAAATQAPDALAANLSGAAAADGPAGSNDSWGNKYAKIVLGLLAENLAVCLALLAVVVRMCVQRKKTKRSPGMPYAPVQFKEPVDD